MAHFHCRSTLLAPTCRRTIYLLSKSSITQLVLVMLLLNTVLQILDILSAMLKLFGGLATLLDICCQCALNRCTQADTPPTEEPSPNVLYTPLSALHDLIYDTIRPQLTHLSSEEQLTLLRGRRFASLADAIIENTPSPIIKKLGLRLPPREKIKELKGWG